jgi:hypothetical protein
VAHEDLHAQLVLELLDLARDARLRGVQRLGGRRDAQRAARDLGQVPQLLQLHKA